VEIDKALNYFCDLIDELPGIRSHRPPKGSGSSKGGWYFPLAHYAPEQLGGLSNKRFAEGGDCRSGCNKPLHIHSVFNNLDIYNQGRPTREGNLPETMTVEQIQKSLAVSETVNSRVIGLPAFKRFEKKYIEQCADAYRKVVENHTDLLEDNSSGAEQGGYSASFAGR